MPDENTFDDDDEMEVDIVPRPEALARLGLSVAQFEDILSAALATIERIDEGLWDLELTIPGHPGRQRLVDLADITPV